MLRVRGLAKSYGTVRAVIHADLDVAAGEALAIMGANGAGKSTLMNMLGGVVQPDGGTIEVDGRAVSLPDPAAATAAGIAFVQQELSVFPTMTVAENVFVGDMPTRAGRVDRAAMRDRTRDLLASLGAPLNPDAPVAGLSTGARQMIEIARALRRDPRVLIFDEPTSSLSASEKDRLHAVVADLKARGVAVLYITHFVSEIFDICDRVTVLREGRSVSDRAIADTSQTEVVSDMLGEVAREDRIAGDPGDGAVMLRVRNLRAPGRVAGADLELRAGEITGLWGLLGSGRTELARAMLGLDGPVTGRIDYGAQGTLGPIKPEALRRHAAFVTEDRRGEGLFLPFAVSDNVALPNLDALCDAGVVRRGRVGALARRMIDALAIKVSGPAQSVGTLSGGNQQKVVFARWLAGSPKLLILDEPTRGLDLSAKAEILRLTVDLARNGAAILLISSELEELMRVSHRYVVVSERRTVATLPGDADKTALIAALARDRVA